MSSRYPLAVINTVNWRWSDQPIDGLTSYDAVLDVMSGAGLLVDLAPLGQASGDDPDGARQVVLDLVDWREKVYGLFAARDQGDPAPESHLLGLSRLVARAHAHRRLVETPGGYAVEWTSPSDLRLPLWVFALTSMEVLTDGRSRRVKLCPGDGCGWLFLDESPNMRRVWCKSSVCGNRARARRHYARHR